jgi:hypothetical protein
VFNLLFANVLIVNAQGNAPSAGDFNSWIQATTPSFGGGTVGGIISAILPYIYGLAGFLILIYIVLGGYQILVSQGDPKQMAAGREKITWAIVGFIIMFAAYWIMQLVGRILNIQRIRNIFG